MKRKPRLARFLDALALQPGAKGAIRDGLSADGVAHVAKLMCEATAAEHGKKRQRGEQRKSNRRRAVERAMQGVFRAGGEPTAENFTAWSEQHRYSKRQLGNIWKALRAPPEIR